MNNELLKLSGFTLQISRGPGNKNNMAQSIEYLKNQGLKIKTKMFKDCEHRIPVEGASLGLGFLRKNLL